jgi:hypothetical protein
MSEATAREPPWQTEFERLVGEMKAYIGGGVLYMTVTIPKVPASEEAEAAEAGAWPVRLQLAELSAEHRAIIDFLIERVASP